MKSSRLLRHSLVLVPAFVLAACGGGGGGGDSSGAAASASQLTITAANSQAVAAEAVEVSGNYQGVTAVGGALVSGVQVEGGGTGANAALLAAGVRTLLGLAPHTGALATGVSTTNTAQCSGGGSITVTVSTSGSGSLATGDGVDFSASSCVEGSGSSLIRMNGRMTLSVTAGSYNASSTTYPKSVTLSLVTANLSVTEGSDTVLVNGDLTMGLTERSPSDASVTLSSSAVSYGIGSHTVTLKNYSTSVDQTSTGSVVTVAADVETNNSRLASGTVAYRITTVTPIQVSPTGSVTAGAIKVTGNGSALLLTATGTDTFSLQVDSNGDGTYESTSSVSRSALQGLL